MGSFSVSCGMSGLPIQGHDKVALILISQNPAEYITDNSSYMREIELYKPFSAPIYGYYDDYGNISDIKKDSTTVALEKFFDLPIQTIVDSATHPKGIGSGFENLESPNLDILNDLKAMFIHKKVFTAMVAELEAQNRLSRLPIREWIELRTLVCDKMTRSYNTVEDTEYYGMMMRGNYAYRSIEDSIVYPDEVLKITLGQDEDVKAFQNILAAGMIMYSINRLFQPSFCGEQEGNILASKRLSDATAKIVKKKLKEYNP